MDRRTFAFGMCGLPFTLVSGERDAQRSVNPVMFDGFSSEAIDTEQTRIFARKAGSGPPVLLLHGFPETHLMWRDVAPILARDFTVVCADLRGYGRSGCPPSTADHQPYSKRAMAADMVSLMARLGFSKFAVAGHDRGGRVAYRLGLDHPEQATKVAVLDVLPTDVAWAHADARFALAYWPWAMLAQPSPLPEQVLTRNANTVVDNALDTWGPRLRETPADVRREYIEALRDPAHASAICEEYRAGATLDRVHDQADMAARRRIRCPLLALWSAKGPLDTWYQAQSGPVALWREWADDVRGQPMNGGHFFPEQSPIETARALRTFFAGA
jgi:haloacetate dehalogenase